MDAQPPFCDGFSALALATLGSGILATWNGITWGPRSLPTIIPVQHGLVDGQF